MMSHQPCFVFRKINCETWCLSAGLHETLKLRRGGNVKRLFGDIPTTRTSEDRRLDVLRSTDQPLAISDKRPKLRSIFGLSSIAGIERC